MKIKTKDDIILISSFWDKENWQNTAEAMVVHHSAFSKDLATNQFNSINNSHKKRWPNFISSMGNHVGYNFIIQEGEIFQARAVGEETAAQIGFNKKYLSVCIAGDYRYDDLSDKDIKAFNKLMTWLNSILNKDLELLEHKELKYSSTVCPGPKISKTFLQDYIDNNTIIDQNETIEKLKEILNKLISILQKLISLQKK